MHVLAIGECMAEMAPTDIEGDYRLGFAGDTFNTAWYLARCAPDVTVSYLTAVGDDAISRNMTRFMRDSGIDDRFVRVVPDKTIGLYLISLNNGERSFSYWRGQSAATGLADSTACLAQAADTADLIYFSGITLAILEAAPRASLLRVLRGARASGKTIVFDPNLRPRLWSSNETMTQAIMEGAAVSDIVLPSFEDEASWFDDATPDHTAARYLNAGATTVFVKNGADPVLFAEGPTRVGIPVEPVSPIIDTTAAGDSFNAGILAGHAAGVSFEHGIAYACNLAREVVQKKGALVQTELPAISVLTGKWA